MLSFLRLEFHDLITKRARLSIASIYSLYNLFESVVTPYTVNHFIRFIHFLYRREKTSIYRSQLPKEKVYCILSDTHNRLKLLSELQLSTVLNARRHSTRKRYIKEINKETRSLNKWNSDSFTRYDDIDNTIESQDQIKEADFGWKWFELLEI